MHRTIDCRLTIDDQGRLYKVEPIGENGEVFEQNNPEDKKKAAEQGIRYGNTQVPGDHPIVKGLDLGGENIRSIVVMAISTTNPPCAFWLPIWTPNGFDWICIG